MRFGNEIEGAAARWRLLLLVGLLLAGCSREGSDGAGARTEKITFNEHIAAVIHGNCTSCHRPGQVGPFPLISYEDVKLRAPLIAHVTGNRTMPPWLPAQTDLAFENHRGLSTHEIGLIQDWVASGAAEGDQADVAPVPQWPDGWQLGEPDLVVRMPEPYSLPAAGTDVFRNFVITVPSDTTRYVTGVELLSAQSRFIHHATLSADRTRRSRALDEADEEVGFDGMLAGESVTPAGHFLSWTPGKTPTFFPPGTAWTLKPGTDLVLQMHLLPGGEPEPVEVSLGLFFSGQPPTLSPMILRLGSQLIDIAPGQETYVTRDRYTLPVDLQVLSIYPHAHYLASRMTVEAMLPDANSKTLLEIPRWDFKWQDLYRYAEPVALPAGTIVTMTFTYDNSAGNPHNPSSPPQRVVYGPSSFDEMGDLWLQVLTDEPTDLQRLKHDYSLKEVNSLIAGYENRLVTDPGNAADHNACGALYYTIGKIEQARAHFVASIRADPTNARAHYNLGLIHEQQGELAQAILQFHSAIKHYPDYFSAHYALGNVLLKTRQMDDAVMSYERAVALNPESANAHRNLAYIFFQQGQEARANEHLQIAERLAQ